MSFQFVSTLTCESRNGRMYATGFSAKEWKYMQSIARKKYGIKSKKKRILKKYVILMFNDALRALALRDIAQFENKEKVV